MCYSISIYYKYSIKQQGKKELYLYIIYQEFKGLVTPKKLYN